jgi:hypothetical protein
MLTRGGNIKDKAFNLTFTALNVSLIMSSQQKQQMDSDKALAYLQSEFPNLTWTSVFAKDKQRGRLIAKFANYWEFEVDCSPIGCMATITAGHQIICRSPNEVGISLEDVIKDIKSKWSKIERSMSKPMHSLHDSTSESMKFTHDELFAIHDSLEQTALLLDGDDLPEGEDHPLVSALKKTATYLNLQN